jgi:predicted secreted acid phosphatase
MGNNVFSEGDRVIIGEKPRACIIDIDGTIANEEARRKYAEDKSRRGRDKADFYAIYFEADRILQDKPIEKARELLRWLEKQKIRIFYVSSRNQSCYEATRRWLENNGFPPGERLCLMKRVQSSVLYKTDTIKDIQRSENVLFGIGDRDSDITAYRNCSVKAIKVKANSETVWERVAKEVKKIVNASSVKIGESP